MKLRCARFFVALAHHHEKIQPPLPNHWESPVLTRTPFDVSGKRLEELHEVKDYQIKNMVLCKRRMVVFTDCGTVVPGKKVYLHPWNTQHVLNIFGGQFIGKLITSSF